MTTNNYKYPEETVRKEHQRRESPIFVLLFVIIAFVFLLVTLGSAARYGTSTLVTPTLFAIGIATTFWVYNDARKNNLSTNKLWAWVIAMLFFWPLVLLLYIFTQRRHSTKTP